MLPTNSETEFTPPKHPPVILPPAPAPEEKPCWLARVWAWFKKLLGF